MQKDRNVVYKILDYAWVILAIIVFIASIKYLNDGTLGEKVATLGIWAPIVIVTLKASTLIFAPLGGSPLYIISGAVYGTFAGVALCFVGDVVGTIICFTLSRRYGMKAVRFFAGNSNVDKIQKAVNLLNDTKSFLKARLAFISIPELLAYAAGLSNIGFWKFLILHLPLSIPTGFILVFLGDKVADFTFKYTIILSFVGVVFASLGVWALSKDYRKIEGL